MTLLPQKSKFDEYVKMGLLRSQSEGDLTVYQYTELTQFDRLWNSVTLNARGIVFDKDGDIVQRCIPKFFNSDEPEAIVARKTMNASQPVVQDKLDGSLIKVTFDDKNGLVVTSKASFTSKQANWAREIIEEKGYTFAPLYTYHFELIHPDNQIVLNYGDKKALVLLAIVSNNSGNEANIYTHPSASQFEKAELLSDDVLSDVNRLNELGLREGIVVNFGSYRLKMKTDEYVRLHRIVTDFTPKRVWEALSQGQVIERQNVPEEFSNWLDETELTLKTDYTMLELAIGNALDETKDMTAKEVGLSDNAYKSYIFAARSGKNIEPMIWKAIKPKEQA